MFTLERDDVFLVLFLDAFYCQMAVGGRVAIVAVDNVVSADSGIGYFLCVINASWCQMANVVLSMTTMVIVLFGGRNSASYFASCRWLFIFKIQSVILRSPIGTHTIFVTVIQSFKFRNELGM